MSGGYRPITPAVRRGIGSFSRGEDSLVEIATNVLAAALDVDEITEALAREQWNSLPLVVSGEMVKWDHETVGSSLEKDSFMTRCRPFAEAVRRAILGEES